MSLWTLKVQIREDSGRLTQNTVGYLGKKNTSLPDFSSGLGILHRSFKLATESFKLLQNQEP